MDYTVIIYDENYYTDLPSIISSNTYSEPISKYKLKKLVKEEKDAVIGIVFKGYNNKPAVMSYKPRRHAVSTNSNTTQK